MIHGDQHALAMQIKELRILDTARHSLIDGFRSRILATGMPHLQRTRSAQRTQVAFIVSAALLAGTAFALIAAQSPPKPAAAMVVYKSAS